MSSEKQTSDLTEALQKFSFNEKEEDSGKETPTIEFSGANDILSDNKKLDSGVEELTPPCTPTKLKEVKTPTKSYDAAKYLKDNLPLVREKYEENLKSKDLKLKKLATAVYLIDIYGFRPGEEQHSEKTGNTGCLLLRVEHVKLLEYPEIQFDFLGKDGVPFKRTFPAPKVYDNVKLFQEGKNPSDKLFTGITYYNLCTYLKKMLTGLTSKNFRTCNASVVFKEKLIEQNIQKSDSQTTKKEAFRKAAEAAQKYCNHKQQGSTLKYYLHPGVFIMARDYYGIDLEEVLPNFIYEYFEFAFDTKEDWTFYTPEETGVIS